MDLYVCSCYIVLHLKRCVHFPLLVHEFRWWWMGEYKLSSQPTPFLSVLRSHPTCVLRVLCSQTLLNDLPQDARKYWQPPIATTTSPNQPECVGNIPPRACITTSNAGQTIGTNLGRRPLRQQPLPLPETHIITLGGVCATLSNFAPKSSTR